MLGCTLDQDKDAQIPNSSAVVSVEHKTANLSVDPSIRKMLPHVFIDGPYGTSIDDIFSFETAILVGADGGVMPFAGILKSIWYRMKTTRLFKVYFFWICHDLVSFEWFQSLLLAIEAQDMDGQIEIHTV